MQHLIEWLNVFRENLSSVLNMANISMTLVDIVEILIISFLGHVSFPTHLSISNTLKFLIHHPQSPDLHIKETKY